MPGPKTKREEARRDAKRCCAGGCCTGAITAGLAAAENYVETAVDKTFETLEGVFGCLAGAGVCCAGLLTGLDCVGFFGRDDAAAGSTVTDQLVGGEAPVSTAAGQQPLGMQPSSGAGV